MHDRMNNNIKMGQKRIMNKLTQISTIKSLVQSPDLLASIALPIVNAKVVPTITYKIIQIIYPLVYPPLALQPLHESMSLLALQFPFLQASSLHDPEPLH